MEGIVEVSAYSLLSDLENRGNSLIIPRCTFREPGWGESGTRTDAIL
jgi:hypothetical protein